MIRKKYGILVDLERCVGCYACEVACKQENRSSRSTSWIRINTIGPESVNGKLRMEYIPLISDGCTFCRNNGLKPSCVDHCPTQALKVCSTAEILNIINSGKHYQVCTIMSLD